MFAIIRGYSTTVLAVVLSFALLVSILRIGGSQPALNQAAIASPQQLLSTSTEVAETTTSLSLQRLEERMNSPYTPGRDTAPLSNTLSQRYLLRLGYSSDDLWKAGIKLVPYDGVVEKACGGLSGNLSVSGLAVKPSVKYPTCPDGNSVIPVKYQTPTKCTVHYNAAEAAQTAQRGSTAAVLAHEIGHCLQFIYGQDKGIDSAFMAIRPSVATLSEHQQNEIFADDFMICRHAITTNWGVDSYYSQHRLAAPTESQCTRLNALYDVYFPL